MTAADGRLPFNDSLAPERVGPDDTAAEAAVQDAATLEQRHLNPVVSGGSPNTVPVDDTLQPPPSFGGRAFKDEPEGAPQVAYVVEGPEETNGSPKVARPAGRLATDAAEVTVEGTDDQGEAGTKELSGAIIPPEDQALATRAAAEVMRRVQGEEESVEVGATAEAEPAGEPAQLEAEIQSAPPVPIDASAKKPEITEEAKPEPAAEPEVEVAESPREIDESAAVDSKIEPAVDESQRADDPAPREHNESHEDKEPEAEESDADSQTVNVEYEEIEEDEEHGTESDDGSVIKGASWLKIPGLGKRATERAEDDGAEATTDTPPRPAPTDSAEVAPTSAAEEAELKAKIDEVLSDIDAGIKPEQLDDFECRTLTDEEVARLFPQHDVKDTTVIAVAGRAADTVWNGFKSLSIRGATKATTYFEGFTSYRIAEDREEAMTVDLVRDDARAPVVSKYYLVTGHTGMRSIFGEIKEPPRLWRSVDSKIVAARIIYRQFARNMETAILRGAFTEDLPKGSFTRLVANMWNAYLESISVGNTSWHHPLARRYRTRTSRRG